MPANCTGLYEGPMQRPRTVSVIIPHYGDPTPTRELIALLSISPPHEIIVVDDHSPIPFPETPGVMVLRREANGGFGSTVNVGAKKATGDLLAILNSDLAIGAGFVTALAKAAEPWQPCVAGPRIMDNSGALAPTARRWPTVAHQTAEWLTPLARWRDTPWWHERVGHDQPAVASGTPIAVDWLVGAALLIPAVDFQAVGGFDERFYMNSEEIDLQRRLMERGLARVLLPGVTVVHSSGGSSDATKRRSWLVDSRLTYAAKWGSSVPLRVALGVATGVNFGWNAVRRLRNSAVHPVTEAKAEWALLTGRSARGHKP